MSYLYEVRRTTIFQWAWVPVVLLLLWWWFRRRPNTEVVVERRIEIALPEASAERPKPAARRQTSAAKSKGRPAARPAARRESAPDDLKKVEGIGPKISGVLQEAGITTFEQLAVADAARLHQILRDAGIRIANPDTWPEQARLAAAGNWKGLKALQSKLSRGRRISSARSKGSARSR